MAPILELGTCKSVASGLEKKYGRTTRKLQFLTCTSLKKVLIYVALKLALDLDWLILFLSYFRTHSVQLSDSKNFLGNFTTDIVTCLWYSFKQHHQQPRKVNYWVCFNVIELTTFHLRANLTYFFFKGRFACLIESLRRAERRHQ